MAGKKLKLARAKIDKKQVYDLTQAIQLIKDPSLTKFDASIDIAVKLNLDTTKSEQQLRGAIALPYYTGKPIRVLALTDNPQAAIAAGADFAGDTDKINDIKSGWMDFDVIITMPKFMVELGKLGKVLGPRGLMPNPKTGTVSVDVPATVKEFKKGKKEYRTDTFGNIHMSVGKTSTPTEQIEANVNTLLDLIKSRKPATVKGTYIQNIVLTSTMGPSIKVKIVA
ncbi:50S ribosomal protein L1 [[Mycoplasma] testudinis]|uniref:50S ribosomal protein L1 n=1 Tax=[Mycoplasma] testudinis TaxID=33924 RepID=UPI00047FEF57|nr:50S ribosomal protein L1 [[Mycoplasma] testudinis]